MITQGYYPLSGGVKFIKYATEDCARDNADKYTVGFWKLKKLK